MSDGFRGIADAIIDLIESNPAPRDGLPIFHVTGLWLEGDPPTWEWPDRPADRWWLLRSARPLAARTAETRRLLAAYRGQQVHAAIEGFADAADVSWSNVTGVGPSYAITSWGGTYAMTMEPLRWMDPRDWKWLILAKLRKTGRYRWLVRSR